MSLDIGKVGTPATHKAGDKDAVHVPKVLCYSNEKLKPGDHVRFLDSAMAVVEKDKTGNPHGLVDPFAGEIKKGSIFNVMIWPGLVVNLSHHYDVEIPGLAKAPEPEPEYEEEEEDYDECKGCY